MLNKKATEYFIEITHKKYPLNSNVTAVFTDEPKAPADAFNEELAQKYEDSFGESILPHLPLILNRTSVTEENVHINIGFFSVVAVKTLAVCVLPKRPFALEFFGRF